MKLDSLSYVCKILPLHLKGNPKLQVGYVRKQRAEKSFEPTEGYRIQKGENEGQQRIVRVTAWLHRVLVVGKGKYLKVLLDIGHGNVDSIHWFEDGVLLRDFDISGLILT
jgi:hypothetical protein